MALAVRLPDMEISYWRMMINRVHILKSSGRTFNLKYLPSSKSHIYIASFNSDNILVTVISSSASRKMASSATLNSCFFVEYQ